MRKITKDMLRAINDFRSFQNGNTRVDCYSLDSGGRAINVCLFGNLIAMRAKGRWSVTLAGWNTPTTRGRVNAIIREFGTNDAGYIAQRKGEAVMFLKDHSVGRVIDTKAWVNI
jgi:hypothetical protein